MYLSIIVPSAPPTNTSVRIASDGQLIFTWNPPKCGNRNGHIIKYEYQFGDDVDIDKTTGFTKATNVVLDKLDNSTTGFRVAAYTSKGRGPYSSITYVIVIQSPQQRQRIGMYIKLYHVISSGASIERGGGVRGRNFRGGKDPQKVIGFGHLRAARPSKTNRF